MGREYKSVSKTLEPDISLKFIMLGSDDSGKSSLIVRHKDDTFIDGKINTPGGVYTSMKLKTGDTVILYKIFDRESKGYNANARGAHGFLLTYDITQEGSLEKAKEQLQFLKTFGLENPSVLLVGTKSDLHAKRKISYDDALKFAQENHLLGPIETSAKNNENVDACFKTLVDNVLDKMNLEPNQSNDVIMAKNILEQYKANRSGDILGKKKYYSIFSRLFGFSLEDKIKAVDAMLAVLNGSAEVESLKPHLNALNDGLLGKTCRNNEVIKELMQRKPNPPKP